jgi:hypothetical protein
MSSYQSSYDTNVETLTYKSANTSIDLDYSSNKFSTIYVVHNLDINLDKSYSYISDSKGFQIRIIRIPEKTSTRESQRITLKIYIYVVV